MFLVDTDGTSVMSADGLIGAGGRIFDVPSGTSATGSFFSPGTGFVSQTPPSVPPGIAAGQVSTGFLAPAIAATLPGAGVTVAAMAGAMEVFIGTFEVTATGDMRPDGKFKAEIEVIGSEGSLKVLNPLSPQSGNLLLLTRNGETSSETFERRPTYSYQLDAFIAAIEEGQPLLTGPDDAVKQMQVIDRCYEAAGLPIRGL